MSTAYSIIQGRDCLSRGATVTRSILKSDPISLLSHAWASWKVAKKQELSLRGQERDTGCWDEAVRHVTHLHMSLPSVEASHGP